MKEGPALRRVHSTFPAESLDPRSDRLDAAQHRRPAADRPRHDLPGRQHPSTSRRERRRLRHRHVYASRCGPRCLSRPLSLAFQTPPSRPPPPPDPPSGLRATVVGNRRSLAWNASPSAALTGAVVECGATPGSALGTAPTGATATSFASDAPTGAFFELASPGAGPAVAGYVVFSASGAARCATGDDAHPERRRGVRIYNLSVLAVQACGSSSASECLRRRQASVQRDYCRRNT